MCGVIGYVGKGTSPDFFYTGLKRLEYRGYDSAGIAMLSEKDIHIERAEGKLVNLEKKLSLLPTRARAGIGHTRWATHGKPSENNAHPHRSGNIVLLHNGIIENYRPLKEFLTKQGYTFLSETDTEVAAHLLHYEFKNTEVRLSSQERMRTAIFRLIEQLRGAYAFGILSLDTPEILYAVKWGSPLVLGRGQGENYLASGITALVEHTKDVLFMEDGEIAVLTSDKVELCDGQGREIKREFTRVEWNVSMMEKGGYRHYMLKEIHEHPQAVAQTINGRIERDTSKINLVDFGISKIDLREMERIQIIACGTSFYAALCGRYLIERLGRVPVEVELASEYRYRTPLVDGRTLVIAVSQSGETADTLHAMKFARERGAKTLAIVNVPGSSIAHVCHAESLTHAGPEVGVASTKAFTSQISSLALFGLAIAQERKSLSHDEVAAHVENLIKVPSLLEKCLSLSDAIDKLSHRYQHFPSVLFIGRGPQWPIALEGALKLKEISYIHADAYAGGELKHGPIALVDERMPVVCLCPRDEYYEKTMSNIEEVKARGGRILAIGTEGDAALSEIADDFIGIPECATLTQPFLTAVPMHLLAYWIAVRKGTDVDQPRNLAKSVTVE